MADHAAIDPPPAPAAPSLADLQRWTGVVARAQAMMLEAGIEAAPNFFAPPGWPTIQGLNDPDTLRRAGAFWREGVDFWARVLDPATPGAEPVLTAKDKRFKAAGWEQPVFDWVRRSYEAAGQAMLTQVDRMEGVDERERERLRFNARAFVDAMSPANFALTNPQVIQRAMETGGESLLRGMRFMLADLQAGQLTHTDREAFEVGRNLATTPGKVLLRTELFELIQYSPTTDRVLETPLVVFPPWINRFYILDLTPEKSFIRWAVEQGLTVFMVSWKSADASMKDVRWDDYVEAQIQAMETIRDLLGVPAVHAIGYCVAGTTLAATLALLTARGEAGKVASATFFTAQVDFSQAGELLHFTGDEHLAAIERLATDGYLDGRVMAATFNSLRSRDLVWNYVTNHYLLGEDYPAFDLLHWNGDTTNLPAGWHGGYLRDLYRDNLLVQPGRMSVSGVPLDLTIVATPTYVQAGREDHIAPAESVWKLTHLFQGPLRFVLAGSGHIAGVVNPPAAGKYQYWTNDGPARTLAEFVEGATETRGSWWPDWIGWVRDLGPGEVPVDGARVPGGGSLPPLADAPGEYVRQR